MSNERSESARMRRIRLRQLRTDARLQAAEAQIVAANATEKNARYMLYAIVVATISSLSTTAAIGYHFAKSWLP